MTDRPLPPDASGDARLVVGLVRGLHGLRGGVRVEVLTDDPARFEPGSLVYPEGSADRLTIAQANADGPGLLVRFEERPDRTSVEDLRDRYLEASAPTEALPEGAYYWHQIVGLEALDTQGAPLGRVTDVFRAGGGEVFVVRGPRGELLVPGVGTVVSELAPHQGRIVVDTEALGLDDEEPRSRVRGRRTTRARKAAQRGEGSVPGTEAAGAGDTEAAGAGDTEAAGAGDTEAAGASPAEDEVAGSPTGSPG